MNDDEKNLIINEGVKNKDDFFNEIKRLLKLFDWFGNNFDAFNDALRGGCGEVDPNGKVFVWLGSAAAKISIGERDWNIIFGIFKDDNNSGHESFEVELY
jgi:RNAse (barnase) inhibitor barstar